MRKRKRKRFPIEAGLYNLNKYKQKNSQQIQEPSLFEKIIAFFKPKTEENTEDSA